MERENGDRIYDSDYFVALETSICASLATESRTRPGTTKMRQSAFFDKPTRLRKGDNFIVDSRII